ncbi:MAG: 4Fe-4S dicluster domain-containing protein [Candidatus Krumholzibacteriia bacterium]
MASVEVGQKVVVSRPLLDEILRALRKEEYTLLGPTLRDGVIAYDEIQGSHSLPEGWTDEQEAGRYRIWRRDDKALFGYTVGPHSWKTFLHPPRLTLWRAERRQRGFEIDNEKPESRKLALVGVRSCELHAIDIQDRVMLNGQHPDPHYASRRADLFVIAVHCTEPGHTCFCSSMQTGPRATCGYDLALTEIVQQGRHDFVVEAGSEAGAGILGHVHFQPADEPTLKTADEAVESAAQKMRRKMETRGLRDLLNRNLENTHWEKVAQRCLGCANCTLVCPTCFCTSVEDVSDLGGQRAERVRVWDSCFNPSFSYIHGGSVSASLASRYRQWLTHKLASWWDQFGTPGCVGCGRCITWCPACIDITEEVRAIRDSDATTRPQNVEVS